MSDAAWAEVMNDVMGASEQQSTASSSLRGRTPKPSFCGGSSEQGAAPIDASQEGVEGPFTYPALFTNKDKLSIDALRSAVDPASAIDLDLLPPFASLLAAAKAAGTGEEAAHGITPLPLLLSLQSELLKFNSAALPTTLTEADLAKGGVGDRSLEEEDMEE